MNYKIFAAFMLTEFEVPPEEITAMVGIVPTETWTAGDFVTKKRAMKHEQNGWQVNSKLESSAELEEHILSILEQLKPGWQALIEISDRYYTEISCAIYLYSDNQVPSIHFDRKVIGQIAELNAALDIDIYTLTNN